MNSWELFEAMTDLEDDTILAAAQSTPHRRVRVMSLLRPLAAACLVFAILLTGIGVFDAVAGENTLRHTLRIREDRVYYVFWNAPMAPHVTPPPYEPTWLPEGYTLTTDWSDDTGNSFIYTVSEDRRDHIWFSCSYVGDGHQHGFGLEKGTYIHKKVTIGEYEAYYFVETTQPAGWLVWIDHEEQIMFSVSHYGATSPEDAFCVAESVQNTKGE